ncbi:MAG TPA: RNA polymerase sigma factor [Thermomonospora sp.]|nr:RNA polymerase sigma factor [Thermomonospora sp.]
MTILERISRRSPEEAPPDAALIERSRTEPEVFAALFDRHADRVHNYLARRAGPTEADDLLSATFLAAFEQRARFDPERSPAGALPWLLGIATNLLRGHRRAEARRWDALARARLEPPEPSHADRVAAQVDATVAARPLVDVLSGLPEGDRDAMLLLAWADLSYEQIAAALEIPVGTVRSRIHRVRNLLRATVPPQPTTETE